MAAHAGLGGWDSCECGFFDRGVAVAAVQPDPAHMVLVGEGDRLRRRHPPQGDVGGALHQQQDPEQPADEEERAENADARDGIGARVEDLRHARPTVPKPLP